MLNAFAIFILFLGAGQSDTPSMLKAPSIAPAAPAVPQAPEPRAGFPAQTTELLKPFQGSWAAYRGENVSWTLDIDGQAFYGISDGMPYEGTIWIRADSKPAQIDLLIEKCECKFVGQASQAIFERMADSILIAAPAPGDSRPSVLDKKDKLTLEMKRSDPAPRPSELLGLDKDAW